MESTWHADDDLNKDTDNCLGISIEDYLPSGSAYFPAEGLGEDSPELSSKEYSKYDICLVCGKDSKSCSLICVLQVHKGSDNVCVSLLLSKIVGKPKREVLFVSMKICRRCNDLVQEVTQLEDNLRFKKQTIRNMFESTVQEHKEKSSVAVSESKISSVCSLRKGIGHNGDCVSASSNVIGVQECKKTVNSKLSENVRKSSRRQASTKKYYCSQCKEEFFSLALWIQHMSKHTDMDDNPTQNKAKQATLKEKKRTKNGAHVCEDCGKTFSCRQALVSHASAHQKGSECSVCGRYLTTKARLKVHLFKFHGIGEEKNKEVACVDCGKCFGTKAGLRYHRNVVHHVGTKYVCEHCNKQFYYHVPYRSHLLYAHGEKKIVCETCGMKFFTVSKLNTHINAVHRSAQSWTCNECDVKFTTHVSYRHHMNVKHLKVHHPCDYCSAQFRKKSSLMFHLWKHSVYICQFCRERFSSIDDLRAHMSSIHGKLVTLKGKKKQNITLLQGKKRTTEEEDHVLSQKPDAVEQIQQSEHVASIVINDLLMTAESYNNNSLQPFSLSACEKLPEKQTYASEEELKVKTLSIMDASQDLRTVDHVQFGTVETLEIKASHDHIEMTPGVSLINVQILGDMEISQSDTLGDLKSSMLADAADHLSHDTQLGIGDNIANHLAVETNHLTEDLTVGSSLVPAGHTLESTDHLEPPCHFDSESHLDAGNDLNSNSLEVTNQIQSSHHLESAGQLQVTGHLDSVDSLSGSSVASHSSLKSSDVLENSNPIKTTDHLQLPSDIEAASSLDAASPLEVNDQCSLPSMITEMHCPVGEQMVPHMRATIHNIADEVDTDMASHIGTTNIHDISPHVDKQIVDEMNADMNQLTTEVNTEIVKADGSIASHISSGIEALSTEVGTHVVDQVDDHIITNIDAQIPRISANLNTQSVDSVRSQIDTDIGSHMAKQDNDEMNQSLDKNMDKMEGVELEPFSVTLDEKEFQYQYVMYISAPGEDSNPS